MLTASLLSRRKVLNRNIFVEPAVVGDACMNHCIWRTEWSETGLVGTESVLVRVLSYFKVGGCPLCLCLTPIKKGGKTWVQRSLCCFLDPGTFIFECVNLNFIQRFEFKFNCGKCLCTVHRLKPFWGHVNRVRQERNYS